LTDRVLRLDEASFLGLGAGTKRCLPSQTSRVQRRQQTQEKAKRESRSAMQYLGDAEVEREFDNARLVGQDISLCRAATTAKQQQQQQQQQPRPSSSSHATTERKQHWLATHEAYVLHMLHTERIGTPKHGDLE